MNEAMFYIDEWSA